MPTTESATAQPDLPIGVLKNGLRGNRSVTGRGSWLSAKRVTGERFNAISYLLAPALQRAIGVPTGFIQVHLVFQHLTLSFIDCMCTRQVAFLNYFIIHHDKPSRS